MRRSVFVTGGTGYIGRALIARLVERGHAVSALVRPGSESKLPRGATAVVGDALARGPWFERVPDGCVFVHLVGTPKPAPWKARRFVDVDLASVDIAIEAARAARVLRFVYLSVARPAPVMRSYQTVRAEGERRIAQAFENVSFLRPWYVLGPGHRWPYLLLPMYAALELWPTTRASARRLGLVTIQQMCGAIERAVESTAPGRVVVEVTAIRSPGSARPSTSGA